jgi:hypothetical protein
MLGAGLLWLLLGSMSWFRSSATRRWFLRAGVFALVALDLLVAARHINPSFPARQTENSEVHKFLRQQREAHRDSGGFMIARVSTQPEDPLQLIPNTLVPEQIRDLNAYAFVDQNSHQPWHELYGDPIRLRGHWMKSFPVDDRIQHPLFDLYGVRYLLSTERFEQLGAPALPPIQGPGGSFYVYERKTALPRAFLVRNARVEQDSERVLGYLTGQELRPRELLLLQDRFGEGIPADQDAKLENPVSAEQLAAASLRFTRSEAGLVSVLVRNSPGAWLLLTDTAMRNWELRRNGDAAPWWRANLSFRACWVPPGDHELTWSYDASPFRRGLWISAFSAALLLLSMLWWTGTSRQSEDSEVVQLGR